MERVKKIYQQLEICTSNSEKLELLADLSTHFLNTDLKRCAEVVEQIGNLAKETDNNKAFGYYYSGMGRIAFKQSKFAEAHDAFKTAIDYARAAGDTMLESNCLHSLGMVYWKEGKFDDSLAVSLKALEYFNNLNDTTGNKALCYNNVGNIYERMGEYDKAEEYYQQGMAILETIGEERMICNVKGNLGVIKMRKQEYAAALKYLLPVHAGFKKLKHDTGEVLTLAHLGHTYTGLRQYAKAMEYFLLVLKRAKNHDHKFAEAEAYRGLGNIYLTMEHIGAEEALKQYEKGMEIVKSIDYQAGICEFYIDFAKAYELTNQIALALDAANHGLAIANDKKLPSEKKRLETLKAQLLSIKANSV